MRVFNESQKFTQWWLKVLFFAIIAVLIYSFFKWYTLNETSLKSILFMILTLIIPLFVMLFIYQLTLKTTIDEVGIHYHFSPLQLFKKTIRWNELKKCYVRTYKPIKEYGGWGYRNIFSKNQAVNVKGNKGIQLEFKNGNKLLLGTQQPEDAQNVIERYIKSNNE